MDLFCEVVVEWVDAMSANSVWTWPLSVSHIYAEKLLRCVNKLTNSWRSKRIRRTTERENLDATVSGSDSEEVLRRIESGQNSSDVCWSHCPNTRSSRVAGERKRVPVRNERAKQNKLASGRVGFLLTVFHEPFFTTKNDPLTLWAL